MKSYESTLAFFYGCRLSSSIFQPRRSSVLLSFFSILSFLSSVAAVQQEVVNQQRITSSLFSSNGTAAVASPSTLLNISRERAQDSGNDELINRSSNLSQTSSNDTPLSPVYLIIIISICSLMCALTIIGNLVVILAVCLVRKLRTASNILIVSLAVSDIFVGLFIMPLAIVLEITNNKWLLGSILCDLWTSTDVLLCTSSILNFLVISIDRYCIINHPFKYAPMRKVKLLSLMIAGVWILSALVSLPPILGWGRPSEKLPICQVNQKLDYQIFATMLSFYIPLIFVLIIYANIYRTAQTAMDTRSSVQMSQFLTHNNSSVNMGHSTGPLTQQQTNGNSCSSPQLFLTASNASNNNKNNNNNDEISSGSTGRRSSKRSGNSPNGSKSLSCLSPSRCLGRRISTPFNGRLSIFVSRRYTFFRHVHLPNQKAIRTLGVILGTFIICWLPFMLYAIIKPFRVYITESPGAKRPSEAPAWLDSILLWFGYSSSMLNPLIYSKFNREFRTPFREIIYCRCKGLNDKIRRQEYLENLYGETHLQPPPPPPPPVLPHPTSTRNSGNPESAV